jgi:chromosome partitioning protein
VLFVDLDSQTNLTFDVGAQAAPPGALEVLTGTSTAFDAIQRIDGGHIIPATPNLAAADSTLTETGKEYRLREALEEISHLYDYVVLDTPPALGILTINALTAANDVIIPAQAEVHSLQGISQLHDTIDAVRKYTNPRLNIMGILITRYNSRTTIARDMKDNLDRAAFALNTKVFNTPIRECVSVKEAQAMQQDIFKYAPKSNAAQDYGELMKEILKAR